MEIFRFTSHLFQYPILPTRFCQFLPKHNPTYGHFHKNLWSHRSTSNYLLTWSWLFWRPAVYKTLHFQRIFPNWTQSPMRSFLLSIPEWHTILKKWNDLNALDIVTRVSPLQFTFGDLRWAKVKHPMKRLRLGCTDPICQEHSFACATMTTDARTNQDCEGAWEGCSVTAYWIKRT